MWWATYMFPELFNMDADWRRRLKPVIFYSRDYVGQQDDATMMADKAQPCDRGG